MDKLSITTIKELQETMDYQSLVKTLQEETKTLKEIEQGVQTNDITQSYYDQSTEEMPTQEEDSEEYSPKSPEYTPLSPTYDPECSSSSSSHMHKSSDSHVSKRERPESTDDDDDEGMPQTKKQRTK